MSQTVSRVVRLRFKPNGHSHRFATHKRPTMVEWRGQHSRRVFHFTAISASWINAVEGFFASRPSAASSAASSRASSISKAAINRFGAHNQQPHPSVWTDDADEIIAAASRGHH